MSRKLSAKREEELARLLLFLKVVYAELVERGHLFQEAFPLLLKGIAEVEEVHGRGALLNGTRMAVNDTLELLTTLPMAELEHLDSRLEEVGAPLLAQTVNASTKRLAKLLRGRRLRSEVDYYLVKNAADDLTSGLSDSEREKAEQLMSGYEHEHRST